MEAVRRAEASGIMVQPITAVLYDLDGTLINSQRDIALAFQHALRQVSDGPLPDENAIGRHIGKPLVEMAQALGYVLTPDQATTFLDAYRPYYATHGTRHTRPYPGVLETLRTLAAYPCGIVTTKLQSQAETILQQLDMTAFFQHIQGNIPGLRLKPAPDAVLRALDALQCVPEQTLMVGDTTADILAGKAAGVQTCAVTYGFGNVEALRACEPTYVIDTFAALVSMIGA